MIQLFYADASFFENDTEFEKYYKEASDFRQKKIDSLRFRKDKNLSLAAAVLLDRGLKSFNLREKDMSYSFVENKKPVFSDYKDLFFNISHSDKAVAVILSDTDSGCDIEKISNCNLKIAKRFFCKDEYDFLLNSKERDVDFYRIWTLKESYMKATGKGMKLPLNSFCMKFSENNISVICDESDGCFNFGEYRGIKDYCLSYCIKNSNEKPKIIKWDFKEESL